MGAIETNISDKAASLKTSPQTKAVQQQEGPLAKAIEQQTARLPSDTFLWAAVGAIAGSAVLQLRGKTGLANFVGHWAPTILLLGVYNKIVKVAGSDRAQGENGNGMGLSPILDASGNGQSSVL